MKQDRMIELVERNAFANYIGMELLEIREGYAKGRIKLEQKHMNIYQGMHGGCAYALADTLTGTAAATYGRYVTTVSGNMNYLLPLKDTEYVVCEAKAVRSGNRVAVVDVRIANDNGVLLCNGSFTYYRFEQEIADTLE